MSQDTSTNQRVSEPLVDSSSSIQPWSVEVKADQLMDDLFSDIDRILDGGSASPNEPAQPEYVSLQPIQIPQITLPPAWIPPDERYSQHRGEAGSALATSRLMDIDLVDTALEARGKHFGRSFDKLLLGVACASLVMTWLLWLASQDKLTWPFVSNQAAVPSVSQEAQANADEQFINYMQRSLEVIDRKAEAKRQRTATSNLPPVSPIPGNLAQAPGRGSPVLERVYIPIYQPPSLPPVRPAPAPPVQTFVPIPMPPVAPSVAPVVPRSMPRVTPMPPKITVPPAPSLPLPPAPSLPLPSASIPNVVAPTAKHTLVGVLELGERSAALFDIDNTTQRIQVGQSIASSGWILVSVSNQEAVIRRNGEVRSVYVGQKF